MQSALLEAPAAAGHRRRLVLAVVWLLALLAAALLHERPATLAELEADVRSGQVSTVHVDGDGLPSGATGYGLQQVRWWAGGVRHGVDVVHASADARVPRGLGERTADEVGSRLLQLDPELSLIRSAQYSSSADVAGLVVPGWLAGVLLLLWLGALCLLLGGPEPWRATRWAWFWVLWVPVVGVTAVLLLSGPTPGLPGPRPGRRRLTGGWACLLVAVLLPGLPG